MIQEVIMYEINCDGCADTLADDGDNIIFEYPSVAKEIARECEWREAEREVDEYLKKMEI